MTRFCFDWHIKRGVFNRESKMILLLFCTYFCSLIVSDTHFEWSGIQFTLRLHKSGVNRPTDQYSGMLLENEILQSSQLKFRHVTVYRNIVNEMKSAVLQIVDSYFECRERDCLQAITTARQKYGEIVKKKFVPYMVCSYTYLSPECAVNIKHATFFSYENIVTTLIECANFKSSYQLPDLLILISELFPKKNTDCNCVKIDQRPIPVSEEQCYSTEYIAIVKKFIIDNFRRVKETYYNASIANPQCNYTAFVEDVIDLETHTILWPDILQQTYPKFEQFKEFFTKLGKAANEINVSIREYIINEEKVCYFTPRQLRQSVLTISNYVVQILNKCVMYRDPDNSFC